MHLPVTALQIWKSFPLPSNLSHLRQGFSGQMSLQWDRPWYFTRPTLHGSKVLPCPCLSFAQWHRDINGVRPCLPSTTKASQMVVVQVSLFWLPMGKPSLYELHVGFFSLDVRRWFTVQVQGAQGQFCFCAKYSESGKSGWQESDVFTCRPPKMPVGRLQCLSPSPLRHEPANSRLTWMGG